MDPLWWMGAVRMRVHRIVHPKTLIIQTNTNRVTLNTIRALPSFVMSVNGAQVFEAQKSTSIHHKSNPYDSSGLLNAFWSKAMSFCKKISIDLIDRPKSCGLLVHYCDVFIRCLNSHSDGTHSLQRTHWWASGAQWSISPNLFRWRKKYLGWPG